MFLVPCLPSLLCVSSCAVLFCLVMVVAVVLLFTVTLTRLYVHRCLWVNSASMWHNSWDLSRRRGHRPRQAGSPRRFPTDRWHWETTTQLQGTLVLVSFQMLQTTHWACILCTGTLRKSLFRKSATSATFQLKERMEPWWSREVHVSLEEYDTNVFICDPVVTRRK